MALARVILLVVGVLYMLRGGTICGADAESLRTDLYGDPLPPGAVARLGTMRLRHPRADVVFSKDSKQLISCGCDGELRLWDVATGKLMQRKRLHWKSDKEVRYRNVVLSPDGATAAAWDGAWAYLYDTATGKKRCQVPANPGGNEPLLTFSPDGKMLAVQQRECGALVQELWDGMEGKKLQRLAAGTIYNVSPVVFSPDGKRLAGAVRDGYVSGRIYLWDTSTGKEIARGSDALVTRSMVFSPDGKTLAAESTTRGEVWLLDAATLKEKIKLKEPDDVRLGRIDRLAFSPDGRLLAGTSSESVGRDFLIWSLDGSKKTRRLSGRFDGWFAFAPNNKTLAGRGKSGSEISVWDAVSGRQLYNRPGHDQSVHSLTVSSDGKYIDSVDDSGMRFCLWDALAGSLIYTREKEDGWIESCLFSPDSKKVISVGIDSVFQVWNVATGKELQRIEIDRHHPGMIPRPDAIGISMDGKRFVAVTSDWGKVGTGLLFVWDLDAGKLRQQRLYRGRLVSEELGLEIRNHAAFAPDGERVTVWLGDRIGIEEIATGSLLVTLPKGVGESIRFAPDGRFVLVSPQNCSKCLSLIEVSSGEETVRLQTGEFSYTASTPDGRAVVVIDAKKMTIWSTLTGERLHEMTWPQDVIDGNGELKVCSLAVLPDGRAATGMAEGDILLWDLAPAKWLRPKPIQDLGRKELDTLWSDLAGNARTACRAFLKLTASPAQTVAFLKDHLQPAALLDAKRIEKPLADLDSDSFEKREAASRELTDIRYRADPVLRRAMENNPSLERRRRLLAILAEPKRPPMEALRTLRAIAVLEHIATPEARRLLEELAGGAAVPETQEAQAALQRLNHRDDSAKGRSAASSNGNNP